MIGGKIWVLWLGKESQGRMVFDPWNSAEQPILFRGEGGDRRGKERVEG